ncbi:MAG: hypothetical protein K2M70_02875 [Lachnospiraceae bacterium]|nr:hypothetical protein [Lachnospiraceae bacterium]
MEIKEVLQTREARVNFLRGLIRLAQTDGIVDENEFVFYRQVAVVLDLGESEVESLEKLKDETNEITVNFETDREKMFFLIQAVQLCWVDNNYSDMEREELRDMCQEMSISVEALEKVEQWVSEGMEWNKRGEALLELH